MSLISKYLLSKFLKNFFIILFSLELFFVGLDFLQILKRLPDSANLQVLYLLYNAFFTLTITLPLSLVFAWVLTLVVLIKSNELVAFYSLGAQKKFIYKPILKVSTFLLTSLFLLQATPLAYSYDQKSKIIHGDYFTTFKSDIFLKYNDYFVYFKKLLPLEKKAEGIHIYKLEKGNVIESIVAEKAFFQNNRWYVLDAKVTQKPQNITWEDSKLEISYEKFLYTLEGFKPKILDTVYESKTKYSIIDAVSALSLLSNQDINTDQIRASLYYEIVSAYFSIPILLLVFVFAGANGRTFNFASFTTASIFGTLVIWGLFFMLNKLSFGGILLPELSILLPFFIWIILSTIIFIKKST
ncbi:MAG: YjgP/YjgQ family permease [Campylobacteraceae bacterium]|nr:YjgP/YjgQ family permease [Campylobacteraceae bacterium]